MFWTLGYDTIYALQDIEDDAMVGVKSSARRLGGNVRQGVGIFYALTKERSQFVRHHATEALNFTITLMIVTFVVPLGLFMLIGGAMLVLGERAAVGSFFGFFLIFPVVGVVSLAALILPIMAMMAAGRGEWYRYPAIFRFVSGPIEPHSG